MTLYIEVEDGKAITLVSRCLKNDNCFIDTFQVDKPKAKGQHFQIVTTFRLPKGKSREEYQHSIRELKGVVSINEI